MNIFEELTGKIKGTNKRIVFPEGEERFVLRYVYPLLYQPVQYRDV